MTLNLSIGAGINPDFLNYGLIERKIITNGKRTIKWWNKAKHLIDQISFTAHIEFVDLIELREVINEVGDTIPQIGILVPVIPAKWNDCLEALEILKDAEAYNFLRLKFLWELEHYNGIEKFRQEHLGYKGTKYTKEQKGIINNLIYCVRVCACPMRGIGTIAGPSLLLFSS